MLQPFLRIYGFEGEAAEEGEGRTRIRKSSYRRPLAMGATVEHIESHTAGIHTQTACALFLTFMS